MGFLAILSFLISYLLGSIPSAYLISRVSGVDIQKAGDKNVGAFNVFRHSGAIPGILTLCADFGKGALSVAITQYISGDMLVIFIAGVFAILGHTFSVFLNFRGGRGIGVITGILIYLLPREAVISLALAALLLFITRNSFWCCGVGLLSVPVLAWLFGEPVLLPVYALFLTCLSGVTHWITSQKLTPGQRKESSMFWIK